MQKTQAHTLQAKSPNPENFFTTMVVVRPFELADGRAIAQIWTDCLEQTVTSTTWVLQPLVSMVMKQLAASATAQNGDIGPEGANIEAHWPWLRTTAAYLWRSTMASWLDAAGSRLDMMIQRVGRCCRCRKALVLTTKSKPAVPCGATVSVAATAHRKGVSAALMSVAAQWDRDAGCTELVLITGNPSAVQFCVSIRYRKLGWTEALAPWHRKAQLAGCFDKLPSLSRGPQMHIKATRNAVFHD